MALAGAVDDDLGAARAVAGAHIDVEPPDHGTDSMPRSPPPPKRPTVYSFKIIDDPRLRAVLSSTMKARLFRIRPCHPRTVAVIAAVAALVTLLPAAWAQDPQDEIPFDPEVRRGTLGNGLTYYIKVNPEPPDRIQLRLGVKAGSVLEEESERGLAHYLEHMAFNGTASFAGNEIIDYLESIGSAFGPDLNAYTSFDETVYQLEVPTDPDVIATAFDIFSEWAYAMTLDPEEVEKERGVVLEEWRLGRGADQRIRDQQFPVLFGDSQYSVRLPIGLQEVIETASADDLRGFYERWYRPDLMAFVAVGDLDPDEMEALIREHFAPPPEGAADFPRAYRTDTPTDRTLFPVPPHADLRVNVATDPEENLTALWIYHKVPAQVGHDRAAYRRLLVDGLFARMINARLYERGREADPPFLAAGSGRSLLVGDAATLYMAAYLDKDRIPRGLDTLLEEMQRVVQHGFTATELEREKANMLRAIESAWHEKDQRPSRRLAEEYLRHFLDGEPVPGVDAEYALQQEMLPEITVEDVNRIADPWRGIHNAVVLLSGPDGIPAGPETEEELIAKVTGGPSLEVAAYDDAASDAPLLAEIPEPGAIVAEEPIDAVDAVRWTLSNGVTVIAKQTDFRDDEVLLAATSPGGTSLVEDADYVAALSADSLVSGSGVGEHDVVTLAKLLAGNTASLSPYIGGLFEGFTGDSSPDDLETLFQLVTLYATAPRLDAGLLRELFVQPEKPGRNPAVATGRGVLRHLPQRHQPGPLPHQAVHAGVGGRAQPGALDRDLSRPVRRPGRLHLHPRRRVRLGRVALAGRHLPGHAAGRRPGRDLARRGHRPAARDRGAHRPAGDRRALDDPDRLRRRHGVEPGGIAGAGGPRRDAADPPARTGP